LISSTAWKSRGGNPPTAFLGKISVSMPFLSMGVPGSAGGSPAEGYESSILSDIPPRLLSIIPVFFSWRCLALASRPRSRERRQAAGCRPYDIVALVKSLGKFGGY
jgi:hypothetical protein